MVDPDVQLYHRSRTDIHTSTIMPAVAPIQLSSLCHLRLLRRIHGKHLTWHAYGSIDNKAKKCNQYGGERLRHNSWVCITFEQTC